MPKKFVPPTPPFTPAVYRCILKHDPRNDCYRWLFRYGPYALMLDQHGCPGGAGFVEDMLKDFRVVERLEWNEPTVPQVVRDWCCKAAPQE